MSAGYLSGALDLRGRKVLVVGLGASGEAATRVLRGLGAEVRITESRPRTEVAGDAGRLETGGTEVLAGGHERGHLEGIDLVVTSPGVPEKASVLAWAGERGVPIWGETELGARLVECPYVAVTGTNGKTTTTEMVAAVMRAAGLDAVACGNVGHPFSLAAMECHEALSVELSSFQLRFHEALRPTVSVLLNLAPDHLDWHGSFEAYRAAKKRIYEGQIGDDVHVGNGDDPAAADISRAAPCRTVWFTLDEPTDGEVGYMGRELVARLDGEARLGSPAGPSPAYRADAAAAAAASLSFGIGADPVAHALSEFRPLPHRGSVVAEVEGIRFIDDSKATNPHAAVASLSGWDRVVLVAGGRSKGIDLSPLADVADRLVGAVVLGEAAEELSSILAGRVSVVRASSIEEAVEKAYGLAGPGTTVILAPACASQDMFRDYRERGDRFAAAAQQLGRRVSRGA